MKTQAKSPAPTKWYALRVVSGKEKKIQQTIEANLRTEWAEYEWGSGVKNVLLLTEKVFKVRNGKRVMRERNSYPGYLIVEIEQRTDKNNVSVGMDEDLRDAINSLPGVIYFLGKNSPIALQEGELAKMMGKTDEMAESAAILEEIPEKGEPIKIIGGAFSGLNGVVEEVNRDKKRVKVIIKIFGKETIAELSLLEVDRVG